MSSETAPKIDDAEEEAIMEALDDTDPVGDPEPEPSDHSKRVMKAASVVPIHDATARKRKRPPARRGPGRPKKVAIQPSEEDLRYHQEVMAKQAEFVDGDEIVRAARDRSSSLETLQLIKERHAMAAATLDFERIELLKRGNHKDVPQIVSRQIVAMKEIANIELQISQFQASVFNLRDERLQRVFALLIDSFRDVLKEMLPPEQFDLIWNRLETSMEGWEDKAEDLVR